MQARKALRSLFNFNEGIIKKVLLSGFILLAAIILFARHVTAVQTDNLPKNRNHIRLFRNFGVAQEIIKNRYDLTFTYEPFITEIKKDDPDHIALMLALNTGMTAPDNDIEQADKFRDWLCNTYNKCNIPDNWWCADATSCEIPEEIFLHLKSDKEITLPLENMSNESGTCTIRGWDSINDHDGNGVISDFEWENRLNINASARRMQDARIPAYYWGVYWNLLECGQAPATYTNPRTAYTMNIGNPLYQSFMVNSFTPYLLNKATALNADGIYFDTANGYGLFPSWMENNAVLEYEKHEDYIMDDSNLLMAIKEKTPSDKIVIGNGWYSSTRVIDGSQWEVWTNITEPFRDFINALDLVRGDLARGAINLVQFNPAYHADYAPNGIYIPGITRDRDQIYALASYYLVAGDRSYFSYGQHPYQDDGKLFFNAINTDVGIPLGGYYVFSDSNGTGQDILDDRNGNFEIADKNGHPYGWISIDPAEVAPASDCQFAGNCAKISLDHIANYKNSHPVTLKPNTTYTLSGYVRTEDLTGGEFYFGANFYPGDFDDSVPKLNECGTSLRGTNGWIALYCTFTTGDDVDGSINFRIQHGKGTAWFDKIELREGGPQKVLARKYSKALVLVRPRVYAEDGYDDPVVYKMGSTYQKLHADGSLGEPSNTTTLNPGEAVILICVGICQNLPPSVPVLVSPADEQINSGQTVNFIWNESSDPDGDKLIYKLTYCTNQDFSGCDPSLIASQVSQSLSFAGMDSVLGSVLTGIIIGIKRLTRRKSALLILIIVITSSILLSCGSGGSGNGTGNASAYSSPPVSGSSYSISGLNPGTYFWKVTADDLRGGTTDSMTSSFIIK